MTVVCRRCGLPLPENSTTCPCCEELEGESVQASDSCQRFNKAEEFEGNGLAGFGGKILSFILTQMPMWGVCLIVYGLFLIGRVICVESAEEKKDVPIWKDPRKCYATYDGHKYGCLDENDQHLMQAIDEIGWGLICIMGGLCCFAQYHKEVRMRNMRRDQIDEMRELKERLDQLSAKLDRLMEVESQQS